MLFLALTAALYAAGPCQTPRDLTAGASLEDLARSYLGNSRYAIAIALATNARTGQGFPYIANPDDLASIARVCIPSKTEARDLTRRWETYERAVNSARLPRISAVSKTLVTIPPDQPVNVVGWVRQDQADRLKTSSGQWINSASADTWVTVEPHLQEFRSAAVGNQRLDDVKLTQRLEQRLGLAPASSKSYFVRIKLEHPEPAVMFRPCVDPATYHVGCAVGPPSKSPADHQQWIYQQYYSSYRQSLISEFPWTALGYTFDWAPALGHSSDFQRMGESEFVIQKDAPIEILDVLTTAAYCAPRGSPGVAQSAVAPK